MGLSSPLISLQIIKSNFGIFPLISACNYVAKKIGNLFSRQDASSKEQSKQKELAPAYVCPLNQDTKNEDVLTRKSEGNMHTRGAENGSNKPAGTGINAL